MAIVKFEDFLFDSSNYLLKRKGRPVHLRPKALQLLSLLINNRHRVVTKDEILLSLWGSEYARDHLLFQLISELRKAPFNSDFVRTQPSLGYQWNVTTDEVSSDFSFSAKIAASIVIAITFFSTLLMLEPQNAPQKSVQLPAQSALTNGVIAMENGELNQAVEWFEFALTENPESSELTLYLAQALLQQNKVEESSERVRALLRKPNLGNYGRMTATDLLSRILQRQGRLREALHYAQASNNVNVPAQCSIDVVEHRVEALTGILSTLPVSPKISLNDISSIKVSGQHRLEGYDDKCAQVKQMLEETSYCEPVDTDVLHAKLKKDQNSIHS